MMLYAQQRAAGHSKLKEDEVGMVSRKKEGCRGKRMLSLLVALTMALLFALAGCSMEGEDTDVDWLSYRLTLAELREMDSSESFQEVVFSTNSGGLSIRQLGTDDMLGNDTRLIDPPAGSRYVVARLLSAEGKLLLEDITNEAVGTVHLRASSGDRFEPCLYVLWGVKFDSVAGFSTNDEQEGFCLLFVVPEGIDLQELSIEVSDS